MIKKKILHYTIGVHWPSRGGVETSIYDTATMTKGLGDHYVMAKGGKVDPGRDWIHFTQSVERHADYPLTAGQRAMYPHMPAVSCDFNAGTVGRIESLDPDIAILYAGDCNAMYIPFIELEFGRKIIRVQSYKTEEHMRLLEMTRADALVVFSEWHAEPFRGRPDFKTPVEVLPKVYDEAIYFDDGKARRRLGVRLRLA